MSTPAEHADFDLKAELARGYAALAKGALSEADAIAEVVSAGAPQSAEGGRLCARVLLARGDLAGAKSALAAAVTKPKDTLGALEDLAELHIRTSDGPAALIAARAARAQAGALVKYVLLTGRAHWMMGSHEEALADFALAAPNAPDVADAQLPLAMALCAADRIPEAVQVLDRFLARRPHGKVATMRIQASFDPAQPEASIAPTEQALQASPDSVDLKVLLAALLTLAGREGAEQQLAGMLDDPRWAARWQGFLDLRAAGCTRFVGLPVQALTEGLKAAKVEGHSAEFGVLGGRSLDLIAARAPGAVHGFDSFHGLPGDFTDGTKAGAYDRRGALPKVAANVVLHPGLFDTTLPEFAKDAGPARLWHIDCDLYASTKTVFDALGDRLVPGSVVVFDDYTGFPGAERHEKRAWDELCAARRIKHRILAGALLAREVTFIVEEIG